MAEKSNYSSGMGVSEAVASTLNKAKTIIGTVDENGENIGIVNINFRVFHKLTTVVVLAFFIPVLCGYFFRMPFGWLPVDQDSVNFLWKLKNYQMFTFGSWLFMVLTYAFFSFCVMFKSNLYSGVEGAYIVFVRYGKIVKILGPGEYWINFDWRISPEYVVSSKYFLLTMPPVRGQDSNNHTMHHSGAFLGHVSDAEGVRKLIAKGGFRNFITRQESTYSTTIRDMMKTASADKFNTFLIEPIDNIMPLKNDNAALDQISKQNLTVELIEKLAEIDSVDVSAINLDEQANVRASILPYVDAVANEYGISLEELAMKLGFNNSEIKEKLEAIKIDEDLIKKLESDAQEQDKKLPVLMTFSIDKENEEVVKTALELAEAKTLGKALVEVCSSFIKARTENL